MSFNTQTLTIRIDRFLFLLLFALLRGCQPFSAGAPEAACQEDMVNILKSFYNLEIVKLSVIYQHLLTLVNL